MPIEDYALIGDCTSCALVGRNGSIDWLCWPRFDSAACLAALVGADENGRWILAPKGGGTSTERRYRDGGMVLETVFAATGEGGDRGEVAVIDFMPVNNAAPTIVRIVEGRAGRVEMESELLLRFDYGTSVPWVTRLDATDGGDPGMAAVAGPAMVVLRTGAPLEGEDLRTVSRFTVEQGQRVAFAMSWGPSHRKPPPPVDADEALRKTEAFWSDWVGKCPYEGKAADLVKRSLLTLKALTFEETGGIVAAATTSLPEQLGGPRNWDYRFCWLRDSTLTLSALMTGGYFAEARRWRDWLQRAVAGSPEQLQIMYGIGGERQLMEWEVEWLGGYENSKPVRVGNAAAGQLQLDVYGEVLAAAYIGRKGRLRDERTGWSMETALLAHLETIWIEPDEGMWEVRGGRRHFVVSKAFCWMAFDRAVRSVEEFGLPGPVKRWRELRDRIHADVCEKGFDQNKNSFVQAYGSKGLDAGLLLLPVIGFLPPDDPRMVGTIEAVEKELLQDGFVLRYRTDEAQDGLSGDEGAFLACSFWLVDAYVTLGRLDEAEALFDRLCGLANDLGLLAEEYDVARKRQVGNFPQAFSHLALVNAARHLSDGVVSSRGMEVEAAENQAA
ncbi:MAG: glycoside hydrolase family 15 protein [Gluconacetobacter diazotrophicus]|nr:glycoside hydrolase family 15 protein [Gluconacetobacter diazotrophicus]